jgi:hypothetical protein
VGVGEYLDCSTLLIHTETRLFVSKAISIIVAEFKFEEDNFV